MRFCRTLVGVVLFSSLAAAWQKNDVPPLPETPKLPVVDEYHGVKVTDAYRWLEDGKNPQVIGWTDAQDKHARAILDPLPLHAVIYQFMKNSTTTFAHYYDLERRGGLSFAMNSQPGKQQDVLVTLPADDPASKHFVLDPSEVDPTNSTAIQMFVPSLDGSKIAVSLAAGGSEMGSIHVYEVASGHGLPDTLTRVTGNGGVGVEWNADGTGLYYTRYPHEGERAPRT